MDRGPRLKFSLMFATIEGGEGAALRAAYIVVYTPPCGRWLAHISLVSLLYLLASTWNLTPRLPSLVLNMLRASQATQSAVPLERRLDAIDCRLASIRASRE